MSTAEKKLRYSFEEYLVIEDQNDFKSEYYQGEIFAMSGGTDERSRISSNISREIGVALLEKECSVYDSNLKVRIEAADAGVYPDCQVICGPSEYYQGRKDVVLNPIVVVEVLSESTAAYDRGGKFSHYKKIPALMEYVLVEQKEPIVDVFRRNEEGLWVQFGRYEGLDSMVELTSIQVSIPANMIYHRVIFPG